MRRAAFAVLSLLIPVVCAAQDAPSPPASPPTVRPPRVEIGAQLGGLAAISSEGVFPLFSAGPRVSVTITDRLGVDVLAAVFRSSESDNLQGLYQIQIRHIVRPGGFDRGSIFLTAGTMGLFQDWDVPEYRFSLPDGTVVVHPARTGIEVDQPLGVVGGVGVQWPLARHVALRTDAQTLVSFHGGWVIQGSLGVSVPLGAYTRP